MTTTINDLTPGTRLTLQKSAMHSSAVERKVHAPCVKVIESFEADAWGGSVTCKGWKQAYRVKVIDGRVEYLLGAHSYLVLGAS